LKFIAGAWSRGLRPGVDDIVDTIERLYYDPVLQALLDMTDSVSEWRQPVCSQKLLPFLPIFNGNFSSLLGGSITV